MKDRFLVTTALENTWPSDARPVLFLGEWCRLYSKKDCWLDMDAEVVPYHWDDRGKLYQDYEYLQALFERLLIELTVELNNIHDVDHTSRHWRILIGPWLMVFLSIIYDRWECLHKAIDTYSIEKTIVYDGPDLKYVPQSMEHFSVLAKTDEWNHVIYSSILKFINFDKTLAVNSLGAKDEKISIALPTRRNILSKIKKMLFASTSFFSRANNYFFIEPYLSLPDLVKLQVKLGQIPVIYQGKNYANFTLSCNSRSWQLRGFKSSNKFEEFAREIIPAQLPLTYLEGYKKLISQVRNNYWPAKPKLIWTSNSFYMDDPFKSWAASKVDDGVPLIIGQHGGHYGQGLFSFTEYHELAISDRYLTWGWKNDDRKITPIGAFKKSVERKKKKHSPRSMLFLLSGTSRYSGGLISVPVSSQWIDYMDDQMAFYSGLPDKIANDTVVRLYPSDYGWSQSSRWKDKFPTSKICDRKTSFKDQLLSTKLVVSGWNSTTYLETMLSDIPTVIFWDYKYFELRPDAIASFEELKKFGIFHDTPLSASNHIKKIWDDVDEWWANEDVNIAKMRFVKKYANSDSVLDKLNSVFRDISKRN